MRSRAIKWIGLVVLLVVLLSVIFINRFNERKPSQIILKGYLGGEKIGVFEDREIAEILRKQYGINFDYQKAGSYDMVSASHEGMNYLFPASQGALELYKKQFHTTPKNEIIYNTPIVIYSRPLVVDALIRQKVVERIDGVHFIHMPELVELMVEGKTWADIGVPELYGPIFVDTTDPAASNSGNMFAALVANTLNGGHVVTGADLENVAPRLKAIYDKLGYMETSSADMFNQFLRTGVGAYPMVAGYENQLLEFATKESQIWSKLKDEIIMLYPVPTVWSTHVYIALDEAGQRGIPALLDSEVQRISWLKHGFRTGANAAEETDMFQVNGVAKAITSVTQLPDDRIMDELIRRIQ